MYWLEIHLKNKYNYSLLTMDHEALEFLNSELEEDCGITNINVIDKLYAMITQFYDVNHLSVEEQGKMYNNFIKLVLKHSK